MPMIVSIMQPYFFPYIGYFQLIAQSDIFVVYDDVQYIKGGWVNRNRILRGGKACWITLPVLGAHYDLAINQRLYRLDPANICRFLRQIEAAYRMAPRFQETFPLVQEIMEFGNPNVAAFNTNLVRRIATHLGAHTRFVLSSGLDKDAQLTGEERVVDICRRLGATRYVNPIGGMHLYHAERFQREGLELCFLEATASVYPQLRPSVVPFLSIIDTLMLSSNEAIAGLLKDYLLIRPDRPSPGSCPVAA